MSRIDVVEVGVDVPLTDGVVRAVTPGSVMRGLLSLSPSEAGEPAEEGPAAAHERAVAAVLGQLAGSPAAASARTLAAATSLAVRERTIRGLESVLLTALLGSPAGSDDEAIAAQIWSDHWATAGSRRFAVLAPQLGDVVVTTAEEVGRRCGAEGGLRDALEGLTRDGGELSLPDEAVHELLVAVVAGAGAACSARDDTSDPLLNPRLAAYLLGGAALQVELVGEASPSPATVEDRTWRASTFCAARLAAGPDLAQLVVRRGDTWRLAPLPRRNDDGVLVQRGFLPPAVTSSGGTPNRRAAPRVVHVEPIDSGAGGVGPDLVPAGDGTYVHPLTGVLVDRFGSPLPGPGGVPTDGPLPIDERAELARTLAALSEVCAVPLDADLAQLCRRVGASALGRQIDAWRDGPFDRYRTWLRPGALQPRDLIGLRR